MADFTWSGAESIHAFQGLGGSTGGSVPVVPGTTVGAEMNVSSSGAVSWTGSVGLGTLPEWHGFATWTEVTEWWSFRRFLRKLPWRRRRSRSSDPCKDDDDPCK